MTTDKKHSALNNPIAKIKRAPELWVTFYYDKPWATGFKRASNTMVAEMKKQMNKGDMLLTFGINSKEDLENSWEKLMYNFDGCKIRRMHLFTHSSKNEGTDGLELYNETFSLEDILRLPKLNWADNSLLRFHGCRTGLNGKKTWSIAGAFSEHQKPTLTVGTAGYSFFSSNEFTHVRIEDSDADIWLDAYYVGRNKIYHFNAKQSDRKPFPLVSFKK